MVKKINHKMINTKKVWIQKYCPKEMLIEINSDPKTKQKICQKNLELRKMLSKKIFATKKSWYQNISVPKNVGPKMLGFNKFWTIHNHMVETHPRQDVHPC